MSDYVVSTNCLTKRYGKQLAVNQVSLHVKRGDIYGFVGKNGAGKTTFLKMISGLAAPTSGEISLFGKQGTNMKQAYSRLGTLIEAPGLYPNLSAYENLKLKCICIGVKDRTCIEECLELVGLGDVGTKKVKNYSLGMKQRLGIAMSLIGNPDLLILDEPINGLDPEGIVQIRDTILHLNKEKNITIIISSHILEELSKIATVYGFINKGNLIQELTKEELMAKCSERIEIKLVDAQRACTILEEEHHITNYKVVDKDTIYVFDHLEDCAHINMSLAKAGICVQSIGVNNESLESYFLELTEGM